MEERDPQIEELRSLLGALPELGVPPELDRRTQKMGALLLAGIKAAQPEECPAAFVWVVVLEMAFALAVGVPALLGHPLPLILPVPNQVLYFAVALNALALLLSPIVLIPLRRRKEL